MHTSGRRRVAQLALGAAGASSVVGSGDDLCSESVRRFRRATNWSAGETLVREAASRKRAARRLRDGESAYREGRAGAV